MENKGTNNPYKDGSYKRIFSAFYKKWFDSSNRTTSKGVDDMGLNPFQTTKNYYNKNCSKLMGFSLILVNQLNTYQEESFFDDSQQT